MSAVELPALLIQQIDQLPEALQTIVYRAWQDYLLSIQQLNLAPVSDPSILSQLVRVWSTSHFVSEHCIRHPKQLHRWIDEQALLKSPSADQYRATLMASIAGVDNETTFSARLRQFRNEALVQIAWRDIAGICDFNSTARDISNVADLCIDVSANWLYDQMVKIEGHPLTPDGEPMRLAVIALGKLGGRELNFSSDVDLLFAYEGAGKTDVSGLSHADFFTRLSQQLIRVLHTRTADGFVFRVDMRLRPYGESGALVLNYSGLSDYYQNQAREWERYPMIKARLVSGRPLACRPLLKLLREFTFNVYVDYGIIQTLREMKRRINREIERKSLRNNIKIGAGGIREIEFIAQCIQLIRGGKDKRLRAGNLLMVLEQLTNAHLLAKDTCDRLKTSYIFLRNIENRLQMSADLQTHSLPEEPLGQQQLAYSLGFSDWPELAEQLKQSQQSVHQLFLKQVTKPSYQFPELEPALDHYPSVQTWLKVKSGLNLDSDSESLTELARLLQGLLETSKHQHLSAASEQRLHTIMPILLAFIETLAHDPLTVFKRVLRILEALMRRTYYFALLLENPKTIEHLVTLSDASPWITDLIASFPMLVDELRNSRTLYAPLAPTELANELRQLLIALPSEDLEQQMDCLREFKHTQVLRVAAADTADLLPLMKVSDHLTFTAITILKAVLDIALRSLCQNSEPPLSYNVLANNHNFMIVAYGKLGGIELGYSSDLDLVFLYDEQASEEFIEAIQPLSLSEFYLKLAKEIIYILHTPRMTGILYKIDTRLRPSGDSGLLVTRLESFLQYQLADAWTWEHQALVRARVVCGSAAAEQQFQKIRQQILSQQREQSTLQASITAMRLKMQQANKPVKKEQFDLKLGRGGITDIEFIIQYCVLNWSHRYPTLLTYPDNIRISEALGAQQILSEQEVTLLCDAYRRLRAEVHRLDLQNAPSVCDVELYQTYRDGVTAIWERFFETCP